MRTDYPVVILGSGPAGVSASLAFKEAKVDSLLIDEQPCCGGQLALIPSPIENFAFAWFENGVQAQAKLEAVARENGLPRLQARVCSLEVVEAGEAVLLQCSAAGGDQTMRQIEIRCKYLILATGLSEKRLSFAPEKLSNQVLYHLKDSDLVQNKRIAIVGGGDSALLKAVKLAEVARKIFVINRSSTLKARPDVVAEIESRANIEVLLQSEIKSLTGDEKIEGLKIKNSLAVERQILIDLVLAKVGYVPNSSLFEKIVALDKHGYVLADNFKTSSSNIFAAGDITAATVPRIATAVGQGMACAGEVIAKIFSSGS